MCRPKWSDSTPFNPALNAPGNYYPAGESLEAIVEDWKTTDGSAVISVWFPCEFSKALYARPQDARFCPDVTAAIFAPLIVVLDITAFTYSPVSLAN